MIEPLDPETPIYSHTRQKSIPILLGLHQSKDSRSVATWKTETGTADESNPTFSAIKQSPKHLAAWTSVTRELISSSSLDIEALIRADLRIAMNIGIERELLRATGVSWAAVLDLEQNSDITVINRASASSVTYDEILQVEEAILGANVAIMGDGTGTLAMSGEKNPRMQNFMRRFGLIWVVSPKMRRLLKSAQEPGDRVIFVRYGIQVIKAAKISLSLAMVLKNSLPCWAILHTFRATSATIRFFSAILGI